MEENINSGINFRLSPFGEQIASRTIFLTGSSRSGTSIMGSLLQSLKGTEFAYEPPMLGILLALIDDLPSKQWLFLFKGYLFEELLMPMIAGRRLNYNRCDTRSSAWNALTAEEIEDKISTHWYRKKLLTHVSDKSLIISMPDVTPWISKLQQHFQPQVIVMIRRPESVLASIMHLGLYDNDRITDEEPLYFPLKNNKKQNIYPWVPREKENDFLKMSPLERTIFHYSYLYKHALSIDNGFFVNYDQMISNPVHYFQQLLEQINLNYGPKTKEILNGFKEPKKDRTIDFSGIDPKTLEDMYSVYEKCIARCLTV